MVKILETANKALRRLRTLGVADIEKRDGLYVSRKLDPQNAAKWAAWAKTYGIPNPLSADDLHVTILYSSVDVKTPMAELPIVVDTQSVYGGCGAFAFFGPDEDCLVFAFRCYELQDRHWQLISLGADSTWPDYRPHLTLSTDAAGFELSDEALQNVPRYIVLGPEVNDAPKQKESDLEAQDGSDEAEAADDGDIIVVVIECSDAAKALLESRSDSLDPIDAAALYGVSKGRSSRGVAKRLAKKYPEVAELAKAARKVEAVRKRVEQDMVVRVQAIPEEVAKRIGSCTVQKNNDEQQILYGIASVSTLNGELVEDLHGDRITTQALVEFNRDILKNARAGKFEHDGEVRTEVVEGLVLVDDLQKALGIDLGFEPYLVGIHVPDPKDWAEVKKGDWELSIAGRLWYYQDEAGA